MLNVGNRGVRSAVWFATTPEPKAAVEQGHLDTSQKGRKLASPAAGSQSARE